MASVQLDGVGLASNLLADTIVEGAVLTSDSSFGVGSAIHCGIGHVTQVRCSVLCSIGRRVFIQLLWWLTRQVRSLLWTLVAFSASFQTVTEMTDTTVE